MSTTGWSMQNCIPELTHDTQAHTSATNICGKGCVCVCVCVCVCICHTHTHTHTHTHDTQAHTSATNLWQAATGCPLSSQLKTRV